MSEIIPGFSPTHNLHKSLAAAKTGADLAPVAIRPSRYLWHMQWILHSLMLLFASLALAPFFFAAFYWPLVWCAFVLALFLSLRKHWCEKIAPPKILSIQNHVWHLGGLPGDGVVVPCGDILLWSWVIVLPLRDADGRKFHLVAFMDSMDQNAWRRLRVWLRICYKNS